MTEHDDGGYILSPGGSDRGSIPYKAFGGRRIRVLAHGGQGPKHITQDKRFLYWTDYYDRTISRLPKNGGIPLVIGTAESGVGGPAQITYADGFLYWAERHPEHRVCRMPAEGGTVEILAEDDDYIDTLAVYQGTVAWTTLSRKNARGTVKVKRPDRPSVITLASKQKEPRGIAIDAHQIFWTSCGNNAPKYFRDGAVYRAPLGPGKKRFVIAKDQSFANALVADDAWIYWATARTMDEPFEVGGIWKRRKDGGERVKIADWYWYEYAFMALDATHVYWIPAVRAMLFRVPKDGGEEEHLMDIEDIKDIESPARAFDLVPRGFVVDARAVYWAVEDTKNAGGAIFSLSL
jgi:hypothetical protein